MAIKLKKRVSKLLKKYHTVFDLLEEYDDLLVITHLKKSIIPHKFYLGHIKKHCLKMTDVTKIKNDSHKGVLVIEPQEHNTVSLLTNRHDNIVSDNFYTAENRHLVSDKYYKQNSTLALTGSGSDRWIKVTNDFADWLEKLIPKIEKATEKAKDAAEKAEHALQIHVAIPKNVKAAKEKRASETDPTPSTKIPPMQGKTTEELQEELEAIDFTAIAGEQLIVWVQEYDNTGKVNFPMLKIDVPILKRTGGLTNNTIVSLIIEKLTEPLSNCFSPDIFTFYQLVADLGFSGDTNRKMRAALTDSFEKRGGIYMLPLLRLGTHLPCATSIIPWKEKGKHKAGVHKLLWVSGRKLVKAGGSWDNEFI